MAAVSGSGGSIQSFSGVAAYNELIPASIGGSGEPERVWGQSTTAQLFRCPQNADGGGARICARGRAAFRGGAGLWVVGAALRRGYCHCWKTVMLSGRPFTVVGVAPRAFHGLDQILYTQFWVPLHVTDQLLPNTSNFESRTYYWLAVTGRLRPGFTREQAAAELRVIAQTGGESISGSREGSWICFRTSWVGSAERAPVRGNVSDGAWGGGAAGAGDRVRQCRQSFAGASVRKAAGDGGALRAGSEPRGN